MEPVATWHLDVDGDVLDYEGEESEVRVKMYVDEYAEPLDGQGDFLPLMVRVEGKYRKIEAGGQYAGELDAGRVSYAWGYLGEAERVARWLRIFHNAAGVASWHDHGWWFAIATPEWVATLGDGADVEAALAQTVQFVTDWCEGHVFGYQVERKQTGQITKTFDNPARGTYRAAFEEWEDTDASCWGLVGYDYAETEALEALRFEGKHTETTGR